MSVVLAQFLSPKFLILYAFIGSAVYVHFRGHVRHGFYRQLTDHSTLMAPYNVLMYLFSAVPNRPFVDVRSFPELAKLADNWQVLREEALRLHDAGRIRAAEGYTDLGFNSFFRRGWTRFYVKWYDTPLPSAQALCPKTVALVESIASINAAMFAVLPPGADLGRHRDPFAGSLRYHLGLATPNSEQCRIFVDGQPYHWRDGEAVMFDETFIHWAENRTDTTRIILFCDIERPLTNRVMAWINHGFKATAIRASQTENFEGDVYYLRFAGKALKRWNRNAYYATKWLLLLLVLWLIFRPG
jgi:beta-hydroxylase